MTDSRTDSPNYIPWLIVVCLWAALHLALATSVAAPVFNGELLGPDGYMRLVRVGELLATGNWYDVIIERSNAPYGDALHWTRPMDAIILALALLILPFVSAEQALFAAAASSAPLIALLCCITMVWAARVLINRDRAFMAVFVLLLQPAVLSYSMTGRADHHSLQFLAFLLCLGFMLRLLGPRTAPPRLAFLAGASFGFALWVSIELLILVALCQAALALNWILRGSGGRQGLNAAIGFAACMAAAIAIERPLADWLTVEYDRISFVHMMIALVTLAFWGAAVIGTRLFASGGVLRHRLLIAGVTSAFGIALLANLFPLFFTGPFSAVDPRIVPIWHDRVAELRPLLPKSMYRVGTFLMMIGVAVPSLALLGWICWRERQDPNWPRWLFLGMISLLYFLFALKHARFAPFVEILSAIALAEIIGRLFDQRKGAGSAFQEQLIRISATVMLMFGTTLTGMIIESSYRQAEAGEANPKCRIEPISDVLNDPEGLGATPLIIGGLLDHGPEIVYRTPHSVVGAPYHRNGGGIFDSYRMLATTVDSESRAIINRRGVDLLIVCPSIGERSFYHQESKDGTLYQRLLDDKAPDWLSRVPINTDIANGFRLYRVKR